MRARNLTIMCGGLLLFGVCSARGQEQPQPVWSQDAEREFGGDQGMTFGEGFRSPQGFAVDFEVFFSDIAREHQIFRQDGLLLLRMDPPAEGGRLSFFVNVNGSLEPRLRSIPVEAGKWYHVSASWDGATMWLRLNDRLFRAQRQGGAEALGRPLEVAAARSGASGLRGKLRNVRVYDRPLTAIEALLLNEPPQSADSGVPQTPHFEFDSDAQSWRGVRTQARVENGMLQADVSAPGALLLADGLDYDIEGAAAISLRLSAPNAKSGTCYAATTAGKREALFPLNADGAMHTYVLWMDQYPEWRGRLKVLALLFDGAAKDVCVDFVRIGAGVQAPPELEIKAVYAEPALPRAGRAFVLRTKLQNQGGTAEDISATLRPPDGLTVLDAAQQTLPPTAYGASASMAWSVRAARAGRFQIAVGLSGPGMDDQSQARPINVAPARDVTLADYVPAPAPIKTKRLVGAHYCPLWKEGSRSGGWEQIEPFPEREPLLGWYDEQNPEVTDWDITWALDHGISFFVYCWYRTHQGPPVETFLGHAIHEGLFNARYAGQFKFCIMWENQFRGHAGVDSEADLLGNLLSFWITTYFKNPGYLVVDNKPLLFIYRPEYVIDDLGGKEQTRRAFDQMRQACRDAGFNGLYILGEDRGTGRAPLELMAALGLDYSFSYCWPIADDPDGPTAIAAQERYWQSRHDLNILPDLLTVSMGWDSTPWSPSFSKWRLTPREFETACRKADAFMNTLPKDSLASKVVLLDNWNEFGEGHYIAPHREYGFGYLDAVRAAFSDAPAEHDDLTPEDIGRGPYDTLYAGKKARDAEAGRRLFRAGGDAPGLAAWWTFDEADDDAFAWDYTRNGHGGRLHEAHRAAGHSGKALVCDGGAVEVPASPAFAPRKGITIAGWVKTDVPDQNDTWFINRILDGHLDAGFRFGLNKGRLTWAVPQSTWSHHLTADEPLPLGRWVHVAGACDNRAIRIYMDGHKVAEMARWGVVKDGGTRLMLGNYDVGHRAYFRGLLDDVRIYDHALPESAIFELAQQGES